jgi:hypothetical protein
MITQTTVDCSVHSSILFHCENQANFEETKPKRLLSETRKIKEVQNEKILIEVNLRNGNLIQSIIQVLCCTERSIVTKRIFKRHYDWSDSFSLPTKFWCRSAHSARPKWGEKT